MSDTPTPFRNLAGLREDMAARMTDAIRGSVMIASGSDGLALTFGADENELAEATVIAERSGGPRPVACPNVGEMLRRTLDFCGPRGDAAIVLRVTVPVLSRSDPLPSEGAPVSSIPGPDVPSTIVCGYRLTVDRAVRLPAETVRAAHLTDPRTGGRLPDEPGLIFP